MSDPQEDVRLGFSVAIVLAVTYAKLDLLDALIV